MARVAGRSPMRAPAAALLLLACVFASCAARGLLDAPAPESATAEPPVQPPPAAEPVAELAAAAAGVAAEPQAPAGVAGDAPLDATALPPPTAPAPRRRVERIARPSARPPRNWVPLSELDGAAFQMAANGSEDAPVHAAGYQEYCYCRVSPSGNCRKSVYNTYSRVQIKNDCAVSVYVAVNVQRFLPNCWWGPLYAPTGTCKGFLEYTPAPTVPPPSSKCPAQYTRTEGWWDVGSRVTTNLVGGPATNKDSMYTKNSGIYWYAESKTKVNGKTLVWSGAFNKGPGDYVSKTLPMRYSALSSGTDSVIRLTC